MTQKYSYHVSSPLMFEVSKFQEPLKFKAQKKGTVQGWKSIPINMTSTTVVFKNRRRGTVPTVLAENPLYSETYKKLLDLYRDYRNEKTQKERIRCSKCSLADRAKFSSLKMLSHYAYECSYTMLDSEFDVDILRTMYQLVDGNSKSKARPNEPVSAPAAAVCNFSTKEVRDEIEKHLITLCAVKNLPLSIAECEPFRNFVNSIIDNAMKIASNRNFHAKTLANEILSKNVARIKKSTFDQFGLFGAQGFRLNLSIDGWSNIKNDEVLGIVVSCRERKLAVSELAKGKSGVDVAAQIEAVMKKYKPELQCVIGSIVTDNAKSCEKAREILACRWPHIVFQYCQAHQVNRIVISILKEYGWNVVDNAAAIVKKFKYNRKAKNELNDCCIRIYGDSARCVYTLQTMVKTRWNSAHACFCSCLRIRTALQDAVKAYNRKVVRADQIMINMPKFIEDIKILERLLKPLVLASLKFQADDVGLSGAMSIFLELFRAIVTSTMEEKFRKSLLQQFIKRWNKLEQPVFILTFFFDPRNFKVAHKMLDSRIDNEVLISRFTLGQYAAFYLEKFTGIDTDNQKEMENLDVGINEYFDYEKFYALRRRSKDDANSFWVWACGITKASAPRLPLLMKMLLSVKVHTSDCERLFSMYGATQTKSRNSLSLKVLSHLNTIKVDYHQNAAQKRKEQRLMTPDEYHFEKDRTELEVSLPDEEVNDDSTMGCFSEEFTFDKGKNINANVAEDLAVEIEGLSLISDVATTEKGDYTFDDEADESDFLCHNPVEEWKKIADSMFPGDVEELDEETATNNIGKSNVQCMRKSKKVSTAKQNLLVPTHDQNDFDGSKYRQKNPIIDENSPQEKVEKLSGLRSNKLDFAKFFFLWAGMSNIGDVPIWLKKGCRGYDGLLSVERK